MKTTHIFAVPDLKTDKGQTVRSSVKVHVRTGFCFTLGLGLSWLMLLISGYLAGP